MGVSWFEVSAYAASHQVYFGTDEQAVRCDPGMLSWETTYYWRVDEVSSVHPNSPWPGSVWSFTTGDFLLVDSLESYTDNDADGEAIWQTWIDGFNVAGNGAQVGNLIPPYAEQTIVYGGDQSMPLLYFNEAGGTGTMYIDDIQLYRSEP